MEGGRGQANHRRTQGHLLRHAARKGLAHHIPRTDGRAEGCKMFCRRCRMDNGEWRTDCDHPQGRLQPSDRSDGGERRRSTDSRQRERCGGRASHLRTHRESERTTLHHGNCGSWRYADAGILPQRHLQVPRNFVCWLALHHELGKAESHHTILQAQHLECRHRDKRNRLCLRLRHHGFGMERSTNGRQLSLHR